MRLLGLKIYTSAVENGSEELLNGGELQYDGLDDGMIDDGEALLDADATHLAPDEDESDGKSGPRRVAPRTTSAPDDGRGSYTHSQCVPAILGTSLVARRAATS